MQSAMRAVDHELAYSPETKGVDFYGDRLLVAAPLHVVYTIDSAQREVTVMRVWSV
jgi:hypothetical protein